VGFEPTISAGERPQTYALDCAVTGTGIKTVVKQIKASRRQRDVLTNTQYIMKRTAVEVTASHSNSDAVVSS
jgi:hypothetical protein